MSNKTNPLGFLYSGDRHHLSVPNYAPPLEFEHGTEILVAECPKEPEDGDGQAIRLYEERWPAVFFRIEVLPDANSVGEPSVGYTIRTGSGQRHLVCTLVDAITTGLVGFKPAAPPHDHPRHDGKG